MKKSTMALLLLMPLLGLLPLALGVYHKFTDTSVLFTAEGGGAAEVYLPPPDLGSAGEAPSLSALEELSGAVAAPEESDIVAVVGAFNTAAAGWLALFLRRREKIEEKVKSIRQDMGDLARMPFKEFWLLVFKSFTSLKEFRRLLLRTNRQYSVYGFSHVSLLPKLAGRPLQWLDRTNRSAAWILELLGGNGTSDWLSKERSLTAVNRAWSIDRAKAVGFMQDHDGTVPSDYLAWIRGDNWRSEPTRSSNPSNLIADMGSEEIAVTLFFQMTEDRQEAFTLIGFGVDVPETLSQWEDLIMAFYKENKLVLKDAILLSAMAVHLPVE